MTDTIPHRDYGRAGVKVSRLGFGAMRLPTTSDGKVDFDPAVELIRQALDGGINIIDSAIGYHGGDSEVAIG
ncbi:MAG: aldo/keto reductase, partial [Phycisphaerae bacterium]|nr:aldo/keto reductase [Phycisphaerae bacterium]